MTVPLLEIKDLHVRFSGTSEPALNGLSLTVGAGEIYALFGPNGAGKTTAINTILGLLPPHRGEVLVAGSSVAAAPLAARARIAYLPESVSLYPLLNGIENLRYFLLLAGRGLSDTDCRDLLLEAGLPEAAHSRRSREYSKGMRQKVAVAVALARQAQLLLLDEPTSGLDPNAAAELARLLRASAERGMAVLMATHDIWRVNETATRMGILHGGRLVGEVDPKNFATAELEQRYLRRLAS